MSANDVSLLVDRIHQGMAEDFRLTCWKTAEELCLFCESPIEVILGSAIAIAMRRQPVLFRVCRQEDCTDSTIFTLIPQYTWRNYRIDFCFRVRSPPPGINTFIECDGFDFHERTPDQAEHDRSKDRSIQEAGIPILRFTGREIHRDCGQCTDQILAFVGNRVRLAS